MKEKLGVAMVISTVFIIVLIALVLLFPQFFESNADTVSFVKGLASALICCLVGIIAAFGYNKGYCENKN